MSEFCPECFEKYNGISCENYVISKDLDICEGCDKLKRVVVCRKSYSVFSRFGFFGRKKADKKKNDRKDNF